MDDFYQGIISAAQVMSIWEVIGVILGFAYLILIMRQNSLGWYAAFFSTAISIWLFWSVSLFMESVLNVYYLMMAVYGWWVWHQKSDDGSQQNAVPKLIITWSIKRHLWVVGVIILMSLATGYGLEKNTSAALPYLDSFTTWGAVITTYMVTQKVLENWLYWLVIDTVAIYLYVDRELYLIALQMAVYIVMIFIGWRIWNKEYKQQTVMISND